VETETIRNYENRDEFFATIKKAKQKIEESLEIKLHGNNVTGIIFNLKNNYGWKDRHDFTSKDEPLKTFSDEQVDAIFKRRTTGGDTSSEE